MHSFIFHCRVACARFRNVRFGISLVPAFIISSLRFNGEDTRRTGVLESFYPSCERAVCQFPLILVGFGMEKNRLEAFSDGVLAIIITIMVLELKVPHSHGWEALQPLLPVFLSYVLSFIYVGIYWNNHHHLLYATETVSGGILWANLHLLFWLSLLPFATGWMGENRFTALPTAMYGLVLLMAAIAYYILQAAIIRRQKPGSILSAALGRDWKGKLSPVLYLAAIPIAFVSPRIAHAVYVAVALIWLVPDRRIESRISHRETSKEN